MAKRRRKPKSPKAWVGSKDMAAEIGVTSRSLSKGAKHGRLNEDAARMVNGRWQFHPPEVKRQWYLNVSVHHMPGHKGRTTEEVAAFQAAHGQSAAGAGVEGLEGIGEVVQDEKLAALRDQVNALNGMEAKVAADRIKILKGEIELAQQINELIRREDAYAAMFEYGQRIRQRFEEVPARVVDEVLACDDRIEAAGVIRDAIDKVLVELTDLPDLKNS